MGSLEGSKVEGGGMVQHIVILLTITTVLLLTSGQQTTGPCPSHGTSCILRHLLSQGLIRDDSVRPRGRNNYRYNLNTDQLSGPQQGRGNRNSKFRADCWDQEKVEGEGEVEVAADTPSTRQKRARG